MSVFKFAAITFAILAVLRFISFIQPSLDRQINQQFFERNLPFDQPDDQMPEFRVVSASLPTEIEIENSLPVDQSLSELDRSFSELDPPVIDNQWTVDPLRTTTIMIHSDWQAIRVVCADQREATLSNTYPSVGVFLCKANAEH